MATDPDSTFHRENLSVVRRHALRLAELAVVREPMGPHVYLGAGGWGLETFSISECRGAPMSPWYAEANQQTSQCYLII
jgi:hypothetical protein